MSTFSEQQHRVGLIGAGEVVRRFYLPVLESRSDIQVRAICSGDGRRAAEIAQLLKIPSVAVDYRSLLDDEEIESVFVCTPPYMHFEIASYAFQCGKNVLLEKPPCGTYEELASLQAISAQSGCVLDVTFNNAAREDNAWLVETVQQGKIGAIELIELEWLRTKPRPDKAWANNPQTAGGGGTPKPGRESNSALTPKTGDCCFSRCPEGEQRPHARGSKGPHRRRNWAARLPKSSLARGEKPCRSGTYRTTRGETEESSRLIVTSFFRDGYLPEAIRLALRSRPACPISSRLVTAQVVRNFK